MDKFISHSSWMRDIPDDARVLLLSIPGTHNSCSISGILGFTKTQDLDLSDQFNAGIRFLDIRLSHYRDNLFVHHDVVHMGKCYGDILAVCSSFLEQHPSEAILMSIKNEGRRDSALGRFAPSQVFGKSRGDPTNWVIRSSSFDHFTAPIRSKSRCRVRSYILAGKCFRSATRPVYAVEDHGWHPGEDHK